MRKQSLILTAWLALPFICLTILMVWIFTSLDKDKLMADAPPVGAGAGDTGNANALGQLLAGRDPDEISSANQARRDGTAIDPFNWPGGTLLTFTHTNSTDRDPTSLEARVVLESKGRITILIRTPKPLDAINTDDDAPQQWGITLDQFGPELTSAKIAVGYRTETSTSADWSLIPIPLEYIIPGETLSSDPMKVPLRIDVIEP